MYGRYLYADLYANNIWAGVETPENSGNYTSSKIPFACATDSPIKCTSVQRNGGPSLGYIFSFGEDNHKDVFVLANNGVYRVVRPSRCNYTCSKENATVVASPSPTTSPPSHSSRLSRPQHVGVLVLFSCFLLFLVG
uniref:HIPL1 protein n=1 Tax=Rhizophora mucronata TaxID=61149 RepID=A0A2P2QLZ9_RHIMU